MKTTINKEFFEQWKDKDVAMWCKKEEYAKEFCKLMAENGLRWNIGESYLGGNYWDDYTIETAYSFNIGEYCYKEWYKNEDYTILDFEDYIIKEKKEKMTKEELTKLLIENFMDEYKMLDLSGLDFSEYNCDINIGHMKVSRDLYQNYQDVKLGLFQNNQKAGNILLQSEQEVGGSLFQGGQKVEGNLHQDEIE